ncbi:hypothetical protein QTN25_009324 [Entamoeba marina]
MRPSDSSDYQTSLNYFRNLEQNNQQGTSHTQQRSMRSQQQTTPRIIKKQKEEERKREQEKRDKEREEKSRRETMRQLKEQQQRDEENKQRKTLCRQNKIINEEERDQRYHNIECYNNLYWGVDELSQRLRDVGIKEMKRLGVNFVNAKCPYALNSIEMNDKINENCIAWIKFVAGKEQVGFNGYDESGMFVFHGTPNTNIPSIFENGFDPDLRKRQVNGPGEYFSQRQDISVQFCEGDGRKNYCMLYSHKYW